MKRITLKTLPTATEQEVFDWVTINLLEQRQKSIIGKACRYRTVLKDGTKLKCAAGWLMTEREYKKCFDDGGFATDWDSLVAEELVPEEHSDFVWKLQRIHDCQPVGSWKREFKALAQEHELDVNF